MQYTKGRRGPESTNHARIDHHRVEGTEQNPLVKGTMMMNLAKGPRMVTFMAQGKHAKAFIEATANNNDQITATVRWTAREAVTIIGVTKRDAVAA